MFTKEWYLTHEHPRGNIGKKFSLEHRKKISDGNKGKIISEEGRKHMSDSKLGIKNPRWREKVGRQGIHEYIRSHLFKPKLCPECKIKKPYDLHNKDKKYSRDLSTWIWLCRKCHMVLDGRYKNLKVIAMNNKGKHLSPDTEFKKGMHYSPATEFKRKEKI